MCLFFQIICWNRRTLKTVWSLPTLGGFVYTLAACSVDPGFLALGVGDNMIRVWNTPSPGRGKTVGILWQGIKSKVTVVSLNVSLKCYFGSGLTHRELFVLMQS